MPMKNARLLALVTLPLMIAVGCCDSYAADAPLLELPDAQEHLRICDNYGSGYFLMSGTETCLRFGGYLRISISGGDNVYARQSGDIKRTSYSWYTRGQYRFYTATPTELGVLRTYVDMRSQWQDGGDRASGSLRNGWIELGGWQVGMADTHFTRWVGGYGSVANDDILTSVSRRTNFISYTYKGNNGLSAIIAVEQGSNGADSGRDAGWGLALTSSNRAYGNFRKFRRNPSAAGLYSGMGTVDVMVDYSASSTKIDEYVPNILGGVKFKPSWGEISAIAAYDAYYQEWASKLRVNINVNDQLSLFFMGGHKTHEDTYRLDSSYGVDGYRTRSATPGDGVYGIYRANTTLYGDWGGDWILWAGGQYRFNETKTSFNVQLVYDDTRKFAASASVMHNIVPGLTLLAELDYVTWNDRIGYDIAYDINGNPSSGVRSSLKGEHGLGALISLQRNF